MESVASYRPLRVFVGSSTAQKDLARNLVERLEKFAQPIPWWEKFPAGETTLETLIKLTTQIDLAVFVVAKDDVLWKDKDETRAQYVTRDNVVYELGLFAGSLGPKRSIIFVDSKNMPNKPSDLNGVTEIRWDSSKSGDFAKAVEVIARNATELFDQLGLGWWAIRFENDVVKDRAMYGVFELVTLGSSLIARFGTTYYSESATTPHLSHKHRSTWESSSVSFARRPEGNATIVVVADVMSYAPANDPSEDARKATRLRTVFEMHQIEEGDFFKGRYFDIESLQFNGFVTARRLGCCIKSEAIALSKKEFGGVL